LLLLVVLRILLNQDTKRRSTDQNVEYW